MKKVDLHFFDLFFKCSWSSFRTHVILDEFHFPLADLGYLSWMRHISFISPAFVSYILHSMLQSPFNKVMWWALFVVFVF